MFSLAGAHKAFAPNDELSDSALADRLQKTVDGFLELVEAATHYPCMKKAWVEFLGESPSQGADRVDQRV